MSNIPPPPPPNIPPPPPPNIPAPPIYSPPPTYGAPPPPPGPGAFAPLASFGARLGALVLDGIISAIVAIPGFVVLATGPTELSSCSVDRNGDIDPNGAFRGICEGPTGGTIAVAVLLFAIAGIALLVFQSNRLGTRGQSLGKQAVGIKVIDAGSGGYIGFGRALGRQLFAGLISGSVCALGYLWAIWDPRNQTWHDKVVSTVVVKA